MKTTELTSNKVEPGATGGMAPEFGRIRDVERLYGLRRGTVYNLLSAGLISGVLLRVKGTKSGIRLISLASVRNFICSQMNQNIPAGAS